MSATYQSGYACASYDAGSVGNKLITRHSSPVLQAFVNYMQYWPGDNNQRDPDMTPWEVIKNNKDLHLKPLAEKTLKEGYLAVIKAAIRSDITAGGFTDPFGGATIRIPKTAASPVKATPIGAAKINTLSKPASRRGLWRTSCSLFLATSPLGASDS